jgi:hypothetical protein
MYSGCTASHQLVRSLPVALGCKHLNCSSSIAPTGQLLSIIVGHQVLRVGLFYQLQQLRAVACQLPCSVKQAAST